MGRSSARMAPVRCGRDHLMAALSSGQATLAAELAAEPAALRSWWLLLIAANCSKPHRAAAASKQTLRVGSSRPARLPRRLCRRVALAVLPLTLLAAVARGRLRGGVLGHLRLAEGALLGSVRVQLLLPRHRTEGGAQGTRAGPGIAVGHGASGERDAKTGSLLPSGGVDLSTRGMCGPWPGRRSPPQRAPAPARCRPCSARPARPRSARRRSAPGCRSRRTGATSRAQRAPTGVPRTRRA